MSRLVLGFLKGQDGSKDYAREKSGPSHCLALSAFASLALAVKTIDSETAISTLYWNCLYFFVKKSTTG